MTIVVLDVQEKEKWLTVARYLLYEKTRATKGYPVSPLLKLMKCNYIKKGGEGCNAHAVKGSNYCFFHARGQKEKHIEATKRGGKTPKKVFEPLVPVNISKQKDIVELLTTTICEVRGGRVDVRIANCIGYLSAHLLKAMEVSDITERIEKIEEAILNHGK